LSFRLSRTGLAASAAVLALVAGCARVPAGSVTPSPTPTVSPTASVTTPTATASPTAAATPTAPTSPSTPTKPAADRRKGSQLDQPYTVNGIIVVSKAHPVSARYGPPRPTAPYHLDAVASKALAKMTAAARKAGVRIVVRSGYRSYATQKAVYQRALQNYPSEASAKAYNAPPGASEHQTGLSMDLWDGVTWSLPMANTATGKWLHKHCHEYGFILRYPKGKQKITGYNYEPWHFRYVGVDVARQFPSSNKLTLEEFLGLA
jgi:D-alanyl-D-alanine carboxypeptidase